MRTQSRDQILTAGTLYQTSPFGNYYLPATSPLYNAGSRSYAEAGLAHYTTRLDQVKEMDESSDMVNIGLHYIATTGPNSTQPKDTDGDGIPDYVEDANGNGQCDAGETDWRNTQTEPGIPDLMNTVYDDVDLDGDGMVGRVEKALSKNPLVPDNPLYFIGLHPGAHLAGQCTIPLGISLEADANECFTMYVNGEPAETGDIVRDQSGHWQAIWDTTTLPNGCYILQLGYNYASASSFSAVGKINCLAFGRPAVANVNNPITFDPINDEFTDVLFIRGTLQVPVSAYEIKIYADSPTGELLATINGAPSGNSIEETWDFTREGVSMDSGLKCEFRFPLDPQVPQPYIKYYSGVRCLPGNSFTLAWGWDLATPLELEKRGLKVRMALVDMLGADLIGDEFDLLPTGPGGNIPWTSAFQLDSSQSAHDRLLNSIADTDSRHFFFWGHGFVDRFSWDRIGILNPIRSREIASVTGNPADPEDRKYNHPYRFVFMDACGTYSRQMVRAFGIPFDKRGNAVTVAEYHQWCRPPRAFVGWDVSTFSSDITCEMCDYYRVGAQQLVLGYWQMGKTVEEAMSAWDEYLRDKQCDAFGNRYRDLEPFVEDKRFNPPRRVYPPIGNWKISGCRDVTRYTPWP